MKTTLTLVREIDGLPLPPTPPVLELVKVLDCPATEAFSLDDFFTTSNTVVRFGWIDPDLKKYFKTQLVPAEGPRNLVVSKLKKNATEK